MSPDPRKDSTAGIADRRDSMAGSAARRSPAYKAACCGALCALALVIMLAGSLIWVGVYAAPLLAVWVLLPIQNLFGNKAALTAFFAAAVISLLILPDREMALFFCCFGWWPAAKTHVDRLRPAAARVAVKVLIYLAVAVLWYSWQSASRCSCLRTPRSAGSPPLLPQDCAGSCAAEPQKKPGDAAAPSPRAAKIACNILPSW